MKKERRSFQPTRDTEIVSGIQKQHLHIYHALMNQTMFCKHLKLEIENFYKTGNRNSYYIRVHIS